jgi:hypothetical protein
VFQVDPNCGRDGTFWEWNRDQTHVRILLMEIIHKPVAIDFLSAVRVRPTHFTLRLLTGTGTNGAWDFERSVQGTTELDWAIHVFQNRLENAVRIVAVFSMEWIRRRLGTRFIGNGLGIAW